MVLDFQRSVPWSNGRYPPSKKRDAGASTSAGAAAFQAELWAQSTQVCICIYTYIMERDTLEREICIYIYMYTYISTYKQTYMLLYIYMYMADIYICTYVYTCVYIYICFWVSRISVFGILNMVFGRRIKHLNTGNRRDGVAVKEFYRGYAVISLDL